MPKVVDHDAYRQDLLARSFSLFARKGYASVTMREIARHLKVSTGTLYHYFETKEDLFHQLVRHVSDQDVQSAVADVQDSSSFAEKIDRLFHFVSQKQDHLRDVLFLVLDFYRQAEDPAQRANLRQTLEGYRIAIEEHLSLPRVVATMLLNLLLGTMLRCLLEPESSSFEEELSLLRPLLNAAAIRQVA